MSTKACTLCTGGYVEIVDHTGRRSQACPVCSGASPARREGPKQEVWLAIFTEGNELQVQIDPAMMLAAGAEVRALVERVASWMSSEALAGDPIEALRSAERAFKAVQPPAGAPRGAR
jgi:hypothetical protein